jgi:hypothetical protein
MSENVQAKLRRQAADRLRELSPEDREALLIKCWMSHDARWFMAVAAACGVEVASRLNQVAAREEGKVEARRLARRLGLPPVANVRDYLAAQETFISLLGPDLLDYTIRETGEDGFEIGVQRCFAYDNVSRAGIGEQYLCGIIPRLLGWFEALGLKAEATPAPEKCLKVQGRECVYAFRVERLTARPPAP